MRVPPGCSLPAKVTKMGKPAGRAAAAAQSSPPDRHAQDKGGERERNAGGTWSSFWSSGEQKMAAGSRFRSGATALFLLLLLRHCSFIRPEKYDLCQKKTTIPSHDICV